MINFFKKIFQKKLWLAVIVLALVFGGYYGYKSFFSGDGANRYVMAAVEKGTFVVSLSGSGLVSAANQIDIKSNVSGNAVYVGVKNGQEVKAGALLVQIDNNDAQKAVRDAQTSLETAKLELDKLLKPLDELSLFQADNSLLQAKESKQKAEDNVKKTCENGFNAVANVFLSLPDAMSGLKSALLDNAIDNRQWNIDWFASQAGKWDNNAFAYKDSVEKTYNKARQSYDKILERYKQISRDSTTEELESFINDGCDMLKLIADAARVVKNYVDFTADLMVSRDVKIPSVVLTCQTQLNSYVQTTNNHFSELVSAKNSIKDSKDAVVSAERTLKERELSTAKAKAAPDELDIRTKKIAVQQKEDALFNARRNLADYFIRATFDGIVAKVNIKKGDLVSSGAIATLITKQKIAEISLNEIDAAKVKVGQKTTLAFDAVDNLTITGEATEIDSLGAVSQGVVTYAVKIAFDAEDERLKPGMSVSAAIITDVKQDALLAPNSAIKQQGDISYVQIVNGTTAISNSSGASISGVAIAASDLRNQQIEVGLSNETMTEIVSGLKQGDVVVAQTITSNSSQNQPRQNAGFGSGGQMMRIMR